MEVFELVKKFVFFLIFIKLFIENLIFQINGLEIRGLLHDLPSGAYGFHVHENGNLSDNCKAAGSHYNPLNKNHGGPYDVERHFGDLGNILFDVSGISRIRITDPILSLYGPQSIFGRIFPHPDMCKI